MYLGKGLLKVILNEIYFVKLICSLFGFAVRVFDHAVGVAPDRKSSKLELLAGRAAAVGVSQFQTRAWLKLSLK